MRARSEWTGLLAIVAALTLVGCEAGRSPVTPEPEISNTAAARAEGGADPMQVVIERGSLDITGRYDNKLNIGTSDPARFSWKGELTEGNNPIARVTIGVPGEAALIEGSWSGGELSNTLVTWGKKQTFAQAGGNLSPSAGVFHVLGTVMLPLYLRTAVRKSDDALCPGWQYAPDSIRPVTSATVVHGQRDGDGVSHVGAGVAERCSP